MVELGGGRVDTRVVQDPEEGLLADVFDDVVCPPELQVQAGHLGEYGSEIEIRHAGPELEKCCGAGGGGAVAERGREGCGVREEAGGDTVGDERGSVAQGWREIGGRGGEQEGEGEEEERDDEG
ncbi:hypothetical protein C3L33_22584, partial [Rhododendron williamsianum]